MKTCKQCKKRFEKPFNVASKAWEKRQWCKRKCYLQYVSTHPSPLIGFKHSKKFKKLASDRMKKLTGDKSPRWKGGRYLNPDGYISIPKNGGRVLEHRAVMEKHIRRPLNSCECVHHIDGNKTNNSIENLVVLNRREHAKEHYKESKINGYWRNKKQPKSMIQKRLRSIHSPTFARKTSLK